MLNSGKTEYMVITSQHYHLTYQRMQPCLTVGGATVPASLRLRNLGSIMDSTMSMDAHIQSVKCAMYFHLRAIKKIRHFLDRETCIRSVISLVMSRLDYCNVLLIGKSVAALRGLQVAQNYAARLITGLGFRDHITAALRELHWLPVHQRIKYKVLTMVYMALYSDDAPGYLRDLVTRRAVGRTLRSSNIPQLTVPPTVAKSQTLVDLCFSVAAPSTYNHLPDGMREDLSFTSFKRKLKTQLFIEYFGR